MKKLYFIFALVILLLNLVIINSEDNNEKVDSNVYKEFENQEEVKVVIQIKEPELEKEVVLKDNKTLEEIKLDKQEIKQEIKQQIGEENIRHEFENHISLEVNEKELEKLKQNDKIKLIASVGKVKAFLQDSVPIINASNSWKLQINNINITGLNETVCVLDTGINFSHSALVGKNKTACLIDCLGGSCAENCSMIDDHGHGTHVAGIVGANGSINGVGIGVNLIGVKVLYSDGSGTFDDVAAGINWCVNNSDTYNISVITMSLGTDCDLYPELCFSSYCDNDISSTLLTPQINNAVLNNVSVIIASGNDGNNQYISSPACIQNATAVGSSDKGDKIWQGTNRNSLLDLVAPGGNSTGSINSTSKSGGYEQRYGTSMATPHVAGAFAIINELYKLQYNRTATVFEIQNLLNATGKKINDSSGTGLNFSRIDVYSAVLFSDAISPVVILNSPLNNYVDNIANQSFNCSASDWQLRNITFYLWNSSDYLIYNETKNISGTGNSSYFNYSFLYGSYKWNCLAKDANGNSAYASTNNSLIINYISVNITNPGNNTKIKIGSSLINNTNFSANVSTNQAILRNITFYLWNSSDYLIYNETKNISGTGNSSDFNYNLTLEGSYKWNFLVFNNFTNYSFAENNYSLTYDLTNPVINGLTTSVSTTSALIGLSSSELCNYSLEYGLNSSLGFSNTNSSFSNIHSISLSGLSSSTTYYYNISYCDFVGNCVTNGTNSFTTSAPASVLTSSSGGGGGGGSDSNNLPNTYVLNSNEISNGAVKSIKDKDKIKFLIENKSDYVIMIYYLNEKSVKVEIINYSINVTLLIGEEKKLNLSSPYYYNLNVKLNSIINNTANVSLKRIEEIIIKKNETYDLLINEKENPLSNKKDNLISKIGKINNIVYYIGIVFIVSVIIIIRVWIIIRFKNKRKNKFDKYKKVFNEKINPKNKK